MVDFFAAINQQQHRSVISFRRKHVWESASLPNGGFMLMEIVQLNGYVLSYPELL